MRKYYYYLKYLIIVEVTEHKEQKTMIKKIILVLRITNNLNRM